MKILITGSSGAIGTNLMLKLLEEGHDLIGIDLRQNPWIDACQTIIKDLSLKSVVPELIDELNYNYIDIVVHLAAHAKVHESVVCPDRALANILMTYNILEFCRKRSLPIILASSREIYGNIHRSTTEESQTQILQAESPYSASKISGEALLYSYSKCYGIPYIAFRFSNVYGRFDNDIQRMERVIPLFIDLISKDQEIKIYGKEKVLDFTYIDDCVDGIYHGIQKLASGDVVNETINIAYGEGRSLVDIYNIACHLLKNKPPISYWPIRSGEIKRYVADITKARNLLGFEPKTNLDTGIALAIKNYGFS